MPPPLIHIGHHKTASSWLSKYLFQDPEQGFETPLDRLAELWPRLVAPSPIEFEASRARGLFAPKLEAAAARGRVPAVAWQRLSGSPDSGGFDSAETARRLSQVFPGARVLIVIREQRSIIRSSYGQYFRVGGPATLRRYLHPPEYGETRIPALNPVYWRYDRLALLYRELFGPDNVRILPFEWLREDPGAFVDAIRSFAGVQLPGPAPALPLGRRRNTGFTALCGAIHVRWSRLTADDRINQTALWPNRELHRFGSRALFWLDERLLHRLSGPLERRWRREIAEFCAGYYDESNRRTAAIAGYPLNGYGYAGIDEG